MRNYIFAVSLISNIILIIALILLNDSNNSNAQTLKFVERVRLQDTQIIEKILIGNISKREVVTALEKEKDLNNYFEKPEENGIGVGSMFLVFDQKNMLSKIESPSFEGP